MLNKLARTWVIFALFYLPNSFATTFSLSPLPYSTDALEPYIDQQTMEIHYSKHHQAYVNNLNAQVANYPELAQMSLEQIMANISKFNSAVRNNGGGHYNHEFFWQIMAPASETGTISADLLAAIEQEFGSLEQMQQQFAQAATSRFGSGWAWLVVTADKKLAITSTANQDNPLMDVEINGQPILALDVWEHAYYLSYQNRRAAYLQHWWQVVNWHTVNALYEQAIK